MRIYFTGRAGVRDSIEYTFTEATRLSAISVLQNPENTSNAAVRLLKKEGYVQIGSLVERAKRFVLDGYL